MAAASRRLVFKEGSYSRETVIQGKCSFWRLLFKEVSRSGGLFKGGSYSREDLRRFSFKEVPIQGGSFSWEAIVQKGPH